ncbi:hypothetical protein [Acinetobacter baumannii]|uniref:hypothetical protein n=1 Tax=Acinetobacter baumannii TaxID=470 RepID=UPI0037BEA909
MEEHIPERATPLEKLEQLYLWYIDWVNQNDAKGCPFHKARMDVGDLYPSIQVVLDEYRNWLFNTTSFDFERIGNKGPYRFNISISLASGCHHQ